MPDQDNNQLGEPTPPSQPAQPVQQEPVVREFIQVDTSNNSRLNKGLDSGSISKETE
jgi:hypothetical protein